MDKKELRTTLKTKRLALSPEFIAEQAELFCLQLQKYFHPVIPAQAGIQQSATGKLDPRLRGDDKLHIGVYLAGKGELDLTPSIHWLWRQGHQLYAPAIQNDDLVFHEYTATTALKINQFGLFEPDSESTIAPEYLDYVFVPLLGFDKHGHRLGMGKGYYDRTFAMHAAGHKPILIGCAYAFQEVPELPHAAHDVVLDVILTP